MCNDMIVYIFIEWLIVRYKTHKLMKEWKDTWEVSNNFHILEWKKMTKE